MNPDFSQAASQALSLALLHFVWQGALVTALCAIALRLTVNASAHVRYAIACGGLVAMPLLVAITVVKEWPPAPPAQITFAIPAATAGPYAQEASQPSAARIPAFRPHSADPVTPLPVSRPVDLQSWILPLWLTGVGCFSLYRLASWIAAIRLRRRGVCAASPDWQDRLIALARTLRFSRPVLLLESSLTDTPLTMGVLRPLILMPIGLLAGLPLEQVELILLHELAHIRRHDYLVNLLQSAIENLLFYHPGVWWLSRQIRLEREFCCDDAVIATTHDAPAYARALADLEQQRAFLHSPALAATGGNLTVRVRRVLGSPAPRSTSAPILALLLLVTCVGLFAWQPSKPVAPTAPTKPVAAQSIPIEVVTPTVMFTAQPTAPPTLIAQAVLIQSPQSPSPAQIPQTELQVQIRSFTETRSMLEAQLRQSLETPYPKWISEEVFWIATPEEQSAFRRLQTDDERQRFIEQFWRRRDPTPNTEENELKEEHYRRIGWSNDRFGFPQGAPYVPGWKSDRGSIYIKYGAPDQTEGHPTPGPGVRTIQEGGGQTTFFAYEIWRYRFIEGVGRDVVIEFVDKAANGEYRMTRDPAEKDALLHVPGAGLTLYEQMGLARKEDRVVPPPQAGNLFERMRQYVQIRPAPQTRQPEGTFKPQAESQSPAPTRTNASQAVKQLIRMMQQIGYPTPIGLPDELRPEFETGNPSNQYGDFKYAELKWLAEEVPYLITPLENKNFFAMTTTNGDHSKFIEEFWQRRDPTPGTERNEFKEEHYRRIAYANEHFAERGIPGWYTNRGAIYIALGPPMETQSVNQEAFDRGDPFATTHWVYHFADVTFGIGYRFIAGSTPESDPNANAQRIFNLLRNRNQPRA